MKNRIISSLVVFLLLLLVSCSNRTPEKVGVFWDSGNNFTEIPMINWGDRIASNCPTAVNAAISVNRIERPRIAINHVNIDQSRVLLSCTENGIYKFKQIAIDIIPDKKQGLFWIVPKETLPDGVCFIATSVPYCNTENVNVRDNSLWVKSDFWPFRTSSKKQ